MIEEYVTFDKHHDDFFERFKEQRVQNLNMPTESTTTDSILFLITPLSSMPPALPTKRISNTSSDSGVNSLPISSTTPSNPINHLPRIPTLIPSTSHIITSPIPPSQPLTPMQRLIHHSTRKYQNKEPK